MNRISKGHLQTSGYIITLNFPEADNILGFAMPNMDSFRRFIEALTIDPRLGFQGLETNDMARYGTIDLICLSTETDSLNEQETKDLIFRYINKYFNGENDA